MNEQIATALTTLIGALITWLIYKVANLVESMIAESKSVKDDIVYSKLKEIIHALIATTDKELATASGKAKADKVKQELIKKYGDELASIGIKPEHVTDIIKYVYESTRSNL